MSKRTEKADVHLYLETGDRATVRVKGATGETDYIVVAGEDGSATIYRAPEPAPAVQTPDPISDPTQREKPSKRR